MQRRPKVRPAVWLPLIILLGFGLRLAGLLWGDAYIHFGQGDGIEAYSVAVDYANGVPQAAYIGQPNYNSHSKLPGPLWTWFCYAGLRAGGSILGVVFAILLLNTATIGLTYLLALWTLGPRPAFWAALFAATFPWAVYYSTSVYNPEVMPFLGSLTFLALWQTVRAERSKAIFWVPTLLLMMPQFHMSGLMLIPAVIIVLALCPVRLDLRWLALGLLAGFSLYLPYLRGELAHNWQNTRGMFGGDSGSGYSWDALKALSAPLSFLVNWAPRWMRNAAEYRALGRACFGLFEILLAVNVLSAMVAGCFVTGAYKVSRQALAGILRTPRQTFAHAPGPIFLTVLFVVPLLIALVAGQSFHTRYCLVLLPLLVCLAAAGTVHWLAAPRFNKFFRPALILTCCANIWLMPAVARFQHERIVNGAVLVPSFRQLEMIYGVLKHHAGAGSPIVLDDAAYLADASLSESVRNNAALIRRYVQVREKETLVSGQTGQPIVFRLLAEASAPAEHTAVAYRGKGIALVAVSPAP